MHAQAMPTTLFDSPWPVANSHFDPRVSLPRLPRLGIVTTISHEFVQKYGREVAALNCYAALHGYGFHLEILNPLPDRHLFQGRLQYLLKYLPLYQWVVQLDADVIPLNYHRPMAELLDDSVAVMVVDRDNGEAMSSYMVKNSVAGREFVEQQLALSTGKASGANYDNGDLHEVLLQRVLAVAPEPDKARVAEVIKLRNTNYDAFIPAFREQLDKYRDKLPHIRVQRVGWGHIRSYEAGAQNLADKTADHITHALETDYLGHGKGLSIQISDDEVLCRVSKDMRKSRFFTSRVLRRHLQGFSNKGGPWAWHPLCWDGDKNVCNPQLSGQRPSPVHTQFDAHFVDHLPRAVMRASSRNVYVDLGARGGESVRLFYETFPNAKAFESFAFEADKKFTQEPYMQIAKQFGVHVNFISAAAWVTDTDNLVFGVYDHASSLFKTSYNNLQGEEGSGNKNVERIKGVDLGRFLKDTFTQDDFVIVKMDVELSEFPLILHLVKTGSIHNIDVLLLECHSHELTSLDQEVTEDTCRSLMEYVSWFGVDIVRWNTGHIPGDWSRRYNDFMDKW
ncbi:hypothetical protein HYH02_004201 [Chlamydomonas schloesseri]|uniref:Methyltransferase FkbM domain-containing protein n=1 Tax=Chlamydomonas schloesseri TaxID=2026947 RepID=A0A835WN92_9CHLO|nr:hypothetical protein HYH02_004201 [Chlamydomonas schloesseri]|eukprot:KAG2450928.1 hypothetical protein HYH02_004201 [Chlamydomonas schloesseri]